MFRSLLTSLTVLLLAGLDLTKVRADFIYSQPWNQNIAWTSSFAPGQGGYWTFDNFRLNQTSLITRAHWVGFFLDYLTPGNNPPTPTTYAWQNYFYSDAPGYPSGFLSGVSVPVASVTTTLLGTLNWGNALVNVYDFSMTYATPFLATANTTYWFSPISIQSQFNPIFAWLGSANGLDSQSVQYGLDGNGFTTSGDYREGDRAFAFEGVVVPVPSGITLSGIGLIGVVLFAYYRRRAALVR